MSRSVVVVTAGLSQPSSTRLLADRLSAATQRELSSRGVAAGVEVVELRDLARDLSDHLVTGFSAPALRHVLDAVAAADGVVAVTPVFSASYSGLFKTFVDVLEPGALTGVPVLLAATAGSARHSLVLEHAMRPLFAHLRAVSVPTAVFAAPQDWGGAGGSAGAGTEADGALVVRVDRAAGELADLVAARPARVPADPFAGTVSLEQLLAAGGPGQPGA